MSQANQGFVKTQEIFEKAPGVATVDVTQTLATSAMPAVVRKSDMTRDLSLVGSGYRFAGPPLEASEPVLQGQFHLTELRPGLILQRTRVCDLHDMQTSVRLDPGLKVGLVVEGASEISLGALDFRLGPRRDDRGRVHNQGIVVAFAEPDHFRRQWRRGRREAKVSLTLRPEWLEYGLGDDEELDTVRAFCSEHLASIPWQPSPRALALAHQIVHAPPLTARFTRLYLECRAVELVSEALSLICRRPAPPAPALSTRNHRRMREICELIAGGDANDWNLATFARHAGMSVTALQRAFRTFSGEPLFAYVRGQRLDAARTALERDGISVAQAADLAGYTSAANFATAFRRRFGAAPRTLRARC